MLVSGPFSSVQMPSVLIVDDNMLARHGLKHLLGLEYRGLIFGEAKTGQEAAALLSERSWDAVAIEVSIPGRGGFQVLQDLRLSYPSVPVLMLSSQTDPRHAVRARHLRASGYVGKNSTRAVLLRAFQSVLAGGEHFATSPHAERSTRPVRPELSIRERDILSACVAGRRMGEIAAELNLSIKTVSTYKRRVLNKLHLNSVADLVRYAIDHPELRQPVVRRAGDGQSSAERADLVGGL